MPVKRTVVIVGQGPRSFQHPDDAEVWVINGPRFPPRWDVLFQLHGLDHIEHKHGPAFLDELRAIAPPRRLLMTQAHPSIPSAERLDLDRLLFVSGSYLTSSIPIAIAYAVMVGAKEILLDGVMWSGGLGQWGSGEGWAVPCVEYHVGRAMALGVHVRVPPGCGLFAHQEFVYGFTGPGSV